MVSARSLVVLVAAASMAAPSCADENADTSPSSPSAVTAPSELLEVDDSTATTAAPVTTAGSTSTTAATTTTATTAAPVTTTTVPPPVLDGRAFASTAVTGFELVAGTQIRLTFTGGEVNASGGCNQFGSTWALDGDVLVVGEIASTVQACEPPSLMDQDTWVAALLASDPTITLDGDTLTLTEGRSSVTFVAAA